MAIVTRDTPFSYTTNSAVALTAGRNGLEGAQKVGCYQDLFTDKTITVYLKEERLFATIEDHAQGAKTSHLDLVGVPKELTREGNLQKLTEFFANTHLIPEKGVEGINRVSVHVSALGGMRPGIPFQPGLALGSVVKGDIIQQMEEYAKQAAYRERIAEQIRTAEQKIELLETKIKAYTDSAKPSKDTLIPLWRKEQESHTTLIKRLAEATNREITDIPIFEGFQQGMVSPIDFKNSTFEVQPRGFDSMDYQSQYINLRENNSDIHDRIKQSSSSSSYSGGGGFLFWNVSANHSHSEAVANRVNQIKSNAKSEGILVINASVTTRNVRTITDVKYDIQKLKMLLNVMEHGSGEDQAQYGISTINQNQKCVYLLTEAVLGGSFTAIVTFLDQSATQRDYSKEQQQKNSSTSVSGSGGFFFFRANAQYANASSSASANEDDVLRSIAQTRVNIEFISQGALPAFNRHIIEREIFKHANLDPSKYELSKMDEKDAEQIVKARGQEREIALVKQQLKMEKAQESALNNVRMLTATKEKQNIHTMESVMEAYESFTGQMTSDEDCGVPIGFYYQVLTEAEIRRLIAEHSAEHS